MTIVSKAQQNTQEQKYWKRDNDDDGEKFANNNLQNLYVCELFQEKASSGACNDVNYFRWQTHVGHFRGACAPWSRSRVVQIALLGR
jgi:hypothetical protein